MAQTGLRSARCPALSSQAELDSYLLTHFSSQELFDPQAYNGLTSIEDQSRYKMLLYRADTMLANNSEHEVPVQLLERVNALLNHSDLFRRIAGPVAPSLVPRSTSSPSSSRHIQAFLNLPVSTQPAIPPELPSPLDVAIKLYGFAMSQTYFGYTMKDEEKATFDAYLYDIMAVLERRPTSRASDLTLSQGRVHAKDDTSAHNLQVDSQAQESQNITGKRQETEQGAQPGNAELEEAGSTIRDQRDTINTLTASLASAERGLDRTGASLDRLDVNIDNLITRAERAESELARANDEIARLRAHASLSAMPADAQATPDAAGGSVAGDAGSTGGTGDD